MTASIIIPTFNDSADLEALLDSIRRTSLRDLEVIVVDDGSTDGSQAMCRARGDVRLIELPQNRGPAHARNVGAAAASGEVLIFADSDVVLDEGSDLLRDMVAVFARHPEVDSVLTITDPRPRSESVVAYNYSVYHTYYMRRILGGAEERLGRIMFFTTRLGAIRRESFRRSGGFCEGLRTVMNEDGEFGARTYYKEFTSYVHRDFVHHHRYPTRFRKFVTNYFRTALVQAQIDATYDTGPDESISRAEQLRRIFALGLWGALPLLPVLPIPVLAVLGAAVPAFLLSFGRMNSLIFKVVPARYLWAWHATYVAITPAIFAGYGWGKLSALLGRDLLAGVPSENPFFSADAPPAPDDARAA